MNSSQVMPTEEFRQAQPWHQHEAEENMQASADCDAWPALNTDEEDEGFIRSSN